jgi:hypothetical protein
MAEDTLRLPAEIVDKFSGPLREMTKAVHQFQDVLKGAHTEGSKGAKEQAKQHKELQESIERTGRTVAGILTPAMAALGLSFAGAGAALAATIGKLKEAGDQFYRIQGILASTGMSVGGLQTFTRTMGEFGIGADEAGASAMKLGDTLAKLGRGNSATIQELESSFHNLHGLISELQGTQNPAERMAKLFDYYASHPAPPDQQRKFLETFGLNPKLADATLEQLRESFARNAQFTRDHPPVDLETLKKIQEAFRDLREEIEGIETDLLRNFGGEGAGAVKRLAEYIKDIKNGLIALKQAWDAAPTWMGGGGKAVPGSPFQPLPPGFGGGIPFLGGGGAGGGASFKDRFDAIKKPVEEGVAQGVRDYYAEKGFAPGLVPQAYHPGGGGGGGKFGSPEYPALSPEQADEVSKGGGGAAPGGGGAPGSSGPTGVDGKVGGGGGSRGGSRGGGAPEGGGGPVGVDGKVGGDTSLSGSAYLKSERARFGAELAANPALKKRLAAIVDLENPRAGVAVAESLFNRQNLIHGSVEKGIGGGSRSFYGPVRRGLVAGRLAELERHPKRLIERMAQIDAALAGSNLTKGHTDQGSRGDPNYIRGGVGVNIAGERFNDWGVPGSRAYREHQQAIVSGERRDLLKNAEDAGVTSRKIEGAAHLNVNFNNLPARAAASLKYSGLFKSGKVDMGHPMPASDPGGGGGDY